MGLMRMELALILVLAGTLWVGSMAQSGCTTAIISLSPCLNYITGNSTTPTASCCSQLASVVKSEPQCLCTVIGGGGGSGLGITINQTQALALPGACKVQTPPVSRCNSAIVPTSSPGNTPTGTPTPPTSPATPSVPSTPATPSVPSTPATPSVPSTPAGSGSTIPSLGGSSDGSLTKLPLPMLLVLLIVASSTSILNYF